MFDWLDRLYLIDFLYLLLLAAGCYRYRDGCRRLRRAQQEDTRYTQIPDADTVAWWRKASLLDKQFGIFFKRYGQFLIAVSLFNLLLNRKTGLEIPLNGFTIAFGFCITIALVIGAGVMGDGASRNCNNTPYKGEGSEKNGLDFAKHKTHVLKRYEIQSFRPREEWQQKPIWQHEFMVLDSFKGDIEMMLKGIRWVKPGAVLYYGSWLVLIVVTTGYHLYVFCYSPA
ncbi:hypothetical protein [Eikenella longinqua]|nr:hypothetical protein [Eikenella longinqua]